MGNIENKETNNQETNNAKEIREINKQLHTVVQDNPQYEEKRYFQKIKLKTTRLLQLLWTDRKLWKYGKILLPEHEDTVQMA